MTNYEKEIIDFVVNKNFGLMSEALEYIEQGYTIKEIEEYWEILDEIILDL